MKYLITIASIIIFQLSLFAQAENEDMILVEGGAFQMGVSESAFADEYPRHKVNLKAFYICKHEVTVGEFSRFTNYRGMRAPQGTEETAASNISWVDAVMYCNWVSGLGGLDPCYEINRELKKTFVKFDPTKNGYRLPTEAEWEYAAKGGNKSKFYSYSGSNDAREVAWHFDAGHELKEVMQKMPNEIGLYDMSGNCSEWVWDYYDANYYKKRVSDNPTGPTAGSKRILRGGSFSSDYKALRISSRVANDENYKDISSGFRIARNEK